MSLNNLLIWMSARGRGSWAQFRSAIEELHIESEEGETNRGLSDDTISNNDLPMYQVVRLNLQRLAHVEFDSSTGSLEWQVVPPVLALTDIGGSAGGILCGARFPALNERLNQLSGVFYDAQEKIGMPACIRLLAQDYESLHVAARMIGVTVQVQAPGALLAAIPPVDDPRSRYHAKPPGGTGWTIERFVPSELRWTTRNIKEERNLEPPDMDHCQTGLFRFRMKYQRFHFLRWGGETFSVPVQVGKYAILRHRRIRRLLRYDSEAAVFSAPVSCRPPFLIERALVLCSGFLPYFDKKSARLEYTGVPVEIARLASGLLRQEIEIK